MFTVSTEDAKRGSIIRGKPINVGMEAQTIREPNDISPSVARPHSVNRRQLLREDYFSKTVALNDALAHAHGSSCDVCHILLSEDAHLVANQDPTHSFPKTTLSAFSPKTDYASKDPKCACEVKRDACGTIIAKTKRCMLHLKEGDRHSRNHANCRACAHRMHHRSCVSPNDVLKKKYPPPVQVRPMWTKTAEGVLTQIQELVLQGATRVDHSEGNLLHLAVATGEKLSAVQWVVDGLGDGCVFDGMAGGGTPLHLACARGHTAVVKWLVSEVEADTLWKDDEGLIPFVYCVIGGHLELAQWLVSHSATDVRASDKLARTPLHIACFYGHEDIARWLVRGTSAAKDMEVCDDEGRYPLHYAALGGSTEVTRVLIAEENADAHVTDDNGWTPLHTACWAGSDAVVRY